MVEVVAADGNLALAVDQGSARDAVISVPGHPDDPRGSFWVGLDR
jgi:hypothetical protein